MRALVFFLLFPVWALAQQPAQVDPAQVVGYARADLNENGYDEGFLLVLDREGGVDLFIHEDGVALDYVHNFIETTRYAPEISALGAGGIEVDLHSADGLGSHDWSWVIDWDSTQAAYVVVEMSVFSTPRMADEAETYCRIDLWAGEVRVSQGDSGAVTRKIDARPMPLDRRGTGASFALCEG